MDTFTTPNRAGQAYSRFVKPFVINSHGRLVFPFNFLPTLEFSVMESLEQLDAVIERDFEAKTPTGTDILERVEAGGYETRYDLLRDVALNLFWVNRYAFTMYEKRPTRWRDVPRAREDVFLPAVTPWEEGERKVAAVHAAYDALGPAFDGDAEDRIFDVLFDVFANRRHQAAELPAIKPTVSEILNRRGTLTFCLPGHDPDYPTYTYEQIRDASEDVAELESLRRMAMVLHNQYPWDRARTRLEDVGALGDDDFVVLFSPRDRQVLDFIERVRDGDEARRRPARKPEAHKPVRPYPPVMVASHFRVMPRLEALSAVKGEVVCTNDDVIRNSAYNWSPMSAADIARKTGIEARWYTQRGLEQISLEAAEAALEGAGRAAEEIGSVIFCTCTSTTLIPSVACWLSGQLGIQQTHGSFDVIAACAGFPYGLAEATRLLQEVERPVLVVFAEKFSDKIGTVRTSRMIFGDGAAAVVVGPAPEGEPPDIDVLQMFASGPVSEVNSIIWPNPEFDNNITVYGPEVRNLAGRYLEQMMGELRDYPSPHDGSKTVLETVDLVVPHQANRTMVTELAVAAGLEPDQLYFNIERVGNVSAASIPIAISDAVHEGVIDRPMRLFAPGFGAGAVGGYAVLRLDPEIVVPERSAGGRQVALDGGVRSGGSSASDDAATAFGG